LSLTGLSQHFKHFKPKFGGYAQNTGKLTTAVCWNWYTKVVKIKLY